MEKPCQVEPDIKLKENDAHVQVRVTEKRQLQAQVRTRLRKRPLMTLSAEIKLCCPRATSFNMHMLIFLSLSFCIPLQVAQQ